MAAYQYSRRNYRPLLALLTLSGVALTGWGTWRSHKPTMQIRIAPPSLQSTLGYPERFEQWNGQLYPLQRPRFSADGKLILVDNRHRAQLYEVASGKLIGQWEIPPSERDPLQFRQRFALEIVSATGENAWYVRCRTVPEKGTRVYRITPGQKELGEPIPELTSVALVSPEGRFVFGYNQKGARLGWDRKTGKVVNFSGKLAIYWDEARIDPRSGAIYGLFRSVKGESQKRAVFLDPETGKELPTPAYLKDPTLAAFRLNAQGVVTGHQDGTITVRPLSSPETYKLTYKTKLHSIDWVCLAGDRRIWAGGLVPTAGKPRVFRMAVECIDREGSDTKLFTQADFTDDERGDEKQWGEVIAHWGKTRLYVLGRTLYEKRSGIRHEAWIGDTKNGKQVRVPWDVPAVTMVLSPQEDFAAWIDKSGTLNLWRVPL